MPKKDTSTHSWLMERRYFSLIIASAFIILSISAFFICYRHHVVNTEQALKEDRSAVNLLSLLLDEHLKKIVSVMESYGNRPLLLRAVKDKNALKARVYLISLTKSNRDVDSVIITDRQGTLWAAYPERPEVLGKNFAYRDWYKDVSKEWKSNISDVYLRVVAEKDLAVAVYVPLFGETGEAIGIMIDTQRTVGLSPLFKQVLLDPGQNITVTDRKGQVVYNSQHDFEKEIRPYPFHPDMKKAIAAKNNTFAVDDPDLGGRTCYITFAPVVSIGWTVIVGRDKRSILLSGSAYYVQVTAIAFLLFLSVIIFLFYSRKQVMTQQILEQLQTEKIIRKGEERYKSYIDVTMQVGWTTNDRGEIVEDNPSFSKYTGRGYEEIKGFGWIEDIHPDDRDRTGQIWRKAVAEKSSYETEYRLRRYDGVYRNFLARGMPLLSENGSVQQWVVSCIDITDRKLAEEALINSEKKYRKIFENATEGIFQSTPEGRYISVNPAFVRIGGYNYPDEMIDTVTDIQKEMYVHQDDRTRLLVLLNKQDIITNFEAEIRRRDNAIIWISMNVKAIRDKDGKVIFLEGTIVDITERKRIEEALRKSEEQFRNLFDNALEGVYQTTPEGRLISANMAFARMFDYASPEEMINKITDLASQIYANQDDRKIAVGILREMGFIKDFECQMRRKDGSIFWASYNGRLTKTPDGIPCFEGFIMDITGRKRAEEDLKKSKILLDSVFSAIQDLILIVDKDLRVLISNWKSPAYTGDTKSPGTHHCYEAFINRDVPCEPCHALEVFATGKAVLTEYFNPFTERFSDIRAYPIFDKNNQVIMVAEHVRDITERKRAEDAFQETQDLMNEVGEIARIGGWKMDLINHKATWTQGTYDIVEIAPGAPIPGPDEHVDYYLPEYRPLVADAMRALIEDDKPLDFEAQLRTAKGNVKWCRAMGKVVREGGKAVEVYGTFQDITERKQAEETLKKKDEELRAMTQQLWQTAKLATMGELASSIAHELNNPLATVSLRVESLIAQSAGDDPRLRELRIIGQEVERMGNLVTSLLQFSRRSQQQISTVDICEEIEKTLELIHYHFRKNNIAVVREFKPDGPLIHADRQQLRQLFLNLFTNASDAMPDGGTLTIRVYTQGSGDRDQGTGIGGQTPDLRPPVVVIEIADTGVGIPPESLTKVLESFYTTKPEGKGTGLGLAICRRIAQAHNGTLNITSEGRPGNGTRVRITLPFSNGSNTASLREE